MNDKNERPNAKDYHVLLLIREMDVVTGETLCERRTEGVFTAQSLVFDTTYERRQMGMALDYFAELGFVGAKFDALKAAFLDAWDESRAGATT